MIEARLALHHPGFALDVDLALPGRGITAVCGASGAGKTTLLRVVAGLEKRADGVLRIDGEVWQDSAAGVFVPPHRRALGMVFQDAALFPHLSVRDNLAFGQRRMRGAGRAPETAPVIELLGIGHLLERRPEKLSGGEQQRVAIARALLTGPRLLLMDEPLAALDERRKAELLPWLDRLHDELEIPLLYVSHSLPEVARLADHLVVLDGGRTLAAGPLAEVLPRLDLPLSRDEDAFVVIDASVGAYDAAYALARLDFAGGALWATSAPRICGSRVRVRIRARDVSLAHAPQQSSIMNSIATRIVEFETQEPGRILARLDAGGTPLLARLTRKSAELLGVAPGMPIYAQIKSVALLD